MTKLTKRNEVFNQQVSTRIERGRYDLSESNVGDVQFGVIYPLYYRGDIVPGDNLRIAARTFGRFLPMVTPAFMDCDLDVRYFYIPKSQLWAGYKDFCAPSSASDLTLQEPKVYWDSKSYTGAGDLADWLGYPPYPWLETNGSNETLQKVSAFPFLAYNRVYNYYYRDENLVPELTFDRIDYKTAPSNWTAFEHVFTGDDLKIWSNLISSANQNFNLQRAAYRKDLFTSALPFTIQSIYNSPVLAAGDTIPELRQKSALQRFLEKKAVGGHRYAELLKLLYGVEVPEIVADMPVYIGGYTCPFGIESVDQNSATGIGDTPQANLAGKGVASGTYDIGNYIAPEAGVIIGVGVVRPTALYNNVCPADRFATPSGNDIFNPDFVAIGDESMPYKEVGFVRYYKTVNSLTPSNLPHPDAEFGYVQRYASMRTSFDMVHGQMRAGGSLESWTMCRAMGDYSNPITGLNRVFIEVNPVQRPFVVPAAGTNNILLQQKTYINAERPLPNYVNPKLD